MRTVTTSRLLFTFGYLTGISIQALIAERELSWWILQYGILGAINLIWWIILIINRKITKTRALKKAQFSVDSLPKKRNLL